MTVFYVGLYLTSIVAANLLVARFGLVAVIPSALVFIGLDLTTRDGLHDAWHKRHLFPKMTALIGAGSLISWLVNRDAGRIALASLLAFASAASVDTLTYHLLGHSARLLKVNGSNVVSALVDSIVFPTVAFGSFIWPVILGQFAAKVIGGFVWYLILFPKKASRTIPPPTDEQASGAKA